jgi:hypothetical protein
MLVVVAVLCRELQEDIANVVTFILNGILKPRLQEIGTLNVCEEVKQFYIVEFDQEINLNKIADVESMGITWIFSVSRCLGVEVEVSLHH